MAGNKVTFTFAHFPGGGPAGERCGGCRNFSPKSGKFAPGKEKFFCRKAQEFAATKRETEAIPRDSAACKYFVKA
jgi:hypothetical protein